MQGTISRDIRSLRRLPRATMDANEGDIVLLVIVIVIDSRLEDLASCRLCSDGRAVAQKQVEAKDLDRLVLLRKCRWRERNKA